MSLNEVVLPILGIVAVWTILGPWQRTWEDWARGRIFEARDNIFLLAAEGHLDFDSEVYRDVRALLNKMLRYAHRASLLRVLVEMLRDKGEAEIPWPLQLVDEIQDKEAREAVQIEIIRAVKAVGQMALMKSPLGWVLVAVAYVLLTIFKVRRWSDKKIPSKDGFGSKIAYEAWNFEGA